MTLRVPRCLTKPTQPATILLVVGVTVCVLMCVLMAARAGAVEGPAVRAVRDDAGHVTATLHQHGATLQTTQLLPPATSVAQPLAQQFAHVVRQLEHSLESAHSEPRHVIRINAYLSHGDELPEAVQLLADWCRQADAAPAITWIITPLPHPTARFALDAVASSDALPREVVRYDPAPAEGETLVAASAAPELVFISGQAEVGDLRQATRDTMAGLFRTLEFAGLTKRHVLQVKCFLAPMDQVSVVRQQLAEAFGDQPVPPVSYVEWESGSRPIEIEVVAAAPKAAGERAVVTFATPPWMKSSAVFSRLARVSGFPRIYTSSFATGDGSSDEQVERVFARLRETLAQVDSDLHHLAKATYYVSTGEASGALNKYRPQIYDPQRPPAASKALVRRIGPAGAEIGIDLIAVPIRE